MTAPATEATMMMTLPACLAPLAAKHVTRPLWTRLYKGFRYMPRETCNWAAE